MNSQVRRKAVVPKNAKGEKPIKLSSTSGKSQHHLIHKAQTVPPNLIKVPSEVEYLLLTAAEKGDVDLLYKALWKNANVNSRKPVYGTNALSLAVQQGHSSIVKVLIRFGASITATDNYGVTAVHWAAVNGRDDIILVLLDALAQQERLPAMNPLLKSLNSVTADTTTLLPLDQSALGSILDRFRTFGTSLDGKLQVNHPGDKLVETTYLGQSGDNLDGAIEGKSPKALKSIFDLPLEKQQSYGVVIQFLASRDKSGNTPLHFASAVNLVKTCATLLQHGSNPCVANNAGCRPSDLTADLGLKYYLKEQETLALERQKQRQTGKGLLADIQPNSQQSASSKVPRKPSSTKTSSRTSATSIKRAHATKSANKGSSSKSNSEGLRDDFNASGSLTNAGLSKQKKEPSLIAANDQYSLAELSVSTEDSSSLSANVKKSFPGKPRTATEGSSTREDLIEPKSSQIGVILNTLAFDRAAQSK